MLTEERISEIDESIEKAELELENTWKKFREIKNHNQIKVLKAFQETGIQNTHYSWVTGYGYDDLGKDKLDDFMQLLYTKLL